MNITDAVRAMGADSLIRRPAWHPAEAIGFAYEKNNVIGLFVRDGDGDWCLNVTVIRFTSDDLLGDDWEVMPRQPSCSEAP